MKKDDESFEEIFSDISKEEKKSKNKRTALIVIGSLVYGALILTAVVFSFLHSHKHSTSRKTSSTQEIVSSTSSDSEQNEAEIFARKLISDEKEYQFSWEVQDFDGLRFDKNLGGTSLEAIISRYGRPDSGEGWIALNYGKETPQIRLRWHSIKRYKYAYVSLVFEKFKDEYKLISKEYYNLNSSKLPIDTEASRDFTWTQAAFDSLLLENKEGNSQTGSTYEEIISLYGPPQNQNLSAEDYISNLKVSYVSPKPDESNMKLRQVELEFIKIDSGSWYLVKKDSVNLN